MINLTLQQVNQASQNGNRRPRNAIEELQNDKCQWYTQYLKDGNFNKKLAAKYNAFVEQFPARKGDGSHAPQKDQQCA